MKKVCTIILAVILVLGIFTVNIPVSKAGTASNDTIAVTITPSPSSMLTGGDVTFKVDIQNKSAAAITNVEVDYGGVNYVSFSQIDAGATKSETGEKINIPTEKLGTDLTFNITYEGGGSLTVIAKVDKTVPVAELKAKCTVNRTAAPVDAKVNFTFELENTGEATLTNVKLSLPPLNSNKVIKTYDTIVPGVQKTFAYEFTMKQDVDVTPTIVFTANGAEQTKTLEVKSIKIADPGLTLELSADNTKPAVGQEVTFTLKVTNSGNALLSSITIYDHLQQVLKEGVSLMPAKGTTFTGKYTFNQTTDVQFSATAQDKDGVKYTYNSNKAKISIPVDQSKLKLELTAKADPYELSEPGPVKFSVTVKNSGSYPLTDVVVSEAKLGKVGTIDYLEAGVDKLVPVPDATVSETSTFSFKVTAKDPDGNAVNAEALPLEVKLNAAAASSNPLESATDLPTESAAAKGDTLGTIVIIMIVIAVLIIAVVIALIIMVNKEKKNKNRSSSRPGAVKTVKYRNKNNF